MFIKQITIEGVEGDVEILRIDGGALVTSDNDILCEVRAEENREKRYWKAYEVARVVCGQVRDRLVWIDDDIVRCTMCGTEYDPLKARPRNGGNDEQR